MRRPLTVWFVVRIRPRRMSLTSTATPDAGRLRGATRRVRSAMSLAMSDRSSCNRVGFEASGGDMRRARSQHVELCGDVLGGQG
jgi:hypothetical protein